MVVSKTVMAWEMRILETLLKDSATASGFSIIISCARCRRRDANPV
jgi:hypothetical protein